MMVCLSEPGGVPLAGAFGAFAVPLRRSRVALRSGEMEVCLPTRSRRRRERRARCRSEATRPAISLGIMLAARCPGVTQRTYMVIEAVDYGAKPVCEEQKISSTVDALASTVVQGNACAVQKISSSVDASDPTVVQGTVCEEQNISTTVDALDSIVVQGTACAEQQISQVEVVLDYLTAPPAEPLYTPAESSMGDWLPLFSPPGLGFFYTTYR